ncbi:MAG: DUF1449 family protein [Gemmatimonadetes bacterium]|nr:MAG: DUF1449 family protein [Gemmatimonadota bacterium]
MELFIWFNYPYLGLLFFAFLMMGMQFLGIGGDQDADIEVDAGVEVEVDLDADVDLELDTNADVDSDIEAPSAGSGGFLHAVLSFLNIGRVPLSIVLVSLSLFMGLTGIIFNSFVVTLLNSYPSPAFILSGVTSVLLGLVGTSQLGKILVKLFPADETYAVEKGKLIGCVGEVTTPYIPPADSRKQGLVDVYNQYGTLLKVPCVAYDGQPKRGDRVVLIDYNPEHEFYYVLVEDSPEYHRYLSE